MSYTPKFKRGDLVRIPEKTLGHDHHDPVRAYVVNNVYPGTSARDTSYKLQGLPEIWPETRLKQ